MTVVRLWYEGRSRREQLMILLMLAIALPLLAWLLVVRPVAVAYDEALERHLEAVDRNGRIRALAERPDGPSTPEQVPSGDLALIVGDAAAQSGLTLGRADPSGADMVEVEISEAPPTAVTQWLSGFERQGIRVEDLRITPSGAGSVSVRARLARGRP